jgi:ribosomal protein L11 methylase PrmA
MKLGGSFRDPSGHVYRVDERIVRTVMDTAADQFEFVRRSGILEALVQDGRVLPFTPIDKEIDALFPGEPVKYLLEVPKLPFVSFPYEWPFAGLKSAALLHLEIQLAALDRNVTLSDASAYNVQFHGPRPIFIDHLSFRRYQSGEVWAGHRQFCEQFLVPLLLHALFGITHNAWYRGSLEGIPVTEFSRLLKWRHFFNRDLLTHVILQSWFQRSAEKVPVPLDKAKAAAGRLPVESFRKMLQGLHTLIGKLEPLKKNKSTWQDYAQHNSYRAEESVKKSNFIRELAARHRPNQLWDFGCNVGDYAKAALDGGAGYVVGFDFDHGALDGCYARAREERLAIQPLFMDMANVSPDQGWRGKEREGLEARGSVDAIVALAFIHHLVITRNIPFGELLDWLLDLAPCGVIEFVPKNDPMVQRLLALREDIFPDYNPEFFRERIARRAEIDHISTLSQNGRMLLSYVRRSHGQ